MSAFKTGLLPENIRRCMAPEQRKDLKVHTTEELSAAADRVTEKRLHREFEQWCLKWKIKPRHQRMDRRTSEAKGWPDFQLGFNGITVYIEFKSPGGKLTEEQIDTITYLVRSGFPVLVTESLAHAINWTKQELGMI